MKRHIILTAAGLAVGLWLATTAACLAQTKAGGTAVVNVQQLIRDSDAGKGVTAEIQKLRSEFQQTVASEQQELQQIQQRLNEQRSTLSPEALQQQAQELAQKAQAYQRDVQQHQAKWDTASRAAAQKIGAEIVQIVDAIEKEQKYSMVLDRAAVVGSTTAPDITAEVLKRLNKQLPAVALDLAP